MAIAILAGESYATLLSSPQSRSAFCRPSYQITSPAHVPLSEMQSSSSSYWVGNNGDDKTAGMLEEEEGLHITNKGDVHDVPDEPEGKWLHWPTLVAYVGPGFLVCIAYLDPGNLEADLQVQDGGLNFCRAVGCLMPNNHVVSCARGSPGSLQRTAASCVDRFEIERVTLPRVCASSQGIFIQRRRLRFLVIGLQIASSSGVSDTGGF